jgi:uncharacterized protein
MFIDLSHVPLDGRELDLVVPPDQCSMNGTELCLLGDVHLSGRLDHADDASFRLEGSLSAGVELECVRCLEPFRLDLAEALDLLFLPSSANDGSSDEEHELKDEDLAVSFYRDDEIDLSQLIREQLYLALPMKPICRADCAGLCPACGANLNLTRCDCTRESVDPRLASLKALLKP